MTRVGAFPRLKRPEPKPVAVTATDVVDVKTEVAAALPSAADAEFDEDGRRLVAAPLASHAFPATILHPPPPKDQPKPTPKSSGGFPRGPRPVFQLT